MTKTMTSGCVQFLEVLYVCHRRRIEKMLLAIVEGMLDEGRRMRTMSSQEWMDDEK